MDIKPDDMEELSEVITAAEFHPQQTNTLVYSSSKGVVRLCDLRERALCDRGGGKVFEQPASEGEKSFFSEVGVCARRTPCVLAHDLHWTCVQSRRPMHAGDLFGERRQVQSGRVSPPQRDHERVTTSCARRAMSERACAHAGVT